MWLGNLVGSTVAQSAFYSEFFKVVFDSPYGKVYWSDVEGWSDRSKAKWIKRLIELEVIERKREGWKGRVYYKLSPQFLAYLNKLWTIGKKRI